MSYFRLYEVNEDLGGRAQRSNSVALDYYLVPFVNVLFDAASVRDVHLNTHV
jgi:hypothetical protein